LVQLEIGGRPGSVGEFHVPAKPEPGEGEEDDDEDEDEPDDEEPDAAPDGEGELVSVTPGAVVAPGAVGINSSDLF
jgi:hypothetical protein